MKNQLWRNSAACADMVWFVEDGELGKKREVCSTCTVKVQCLEFALEQKDETTVVYAGTTGNGRKKMMAK